MRLKLVPLLLVCACSTLGSESELRPLPPSSGAGPFRKLDADEVPGVAPYVLNSPEAKYRSPSAAFDAQGRVALYAIASIEGQDAVVRTLASDGRSFFGTSIDIGRKPNVVLAPSARRILSAEVVKSAGGWSLYTLMEDALEVRTSPDGKTFDGPLAKLSWSPIAWTLGIDSMGIAEANGETRVYLASNCRIGETRRSGEQLVWIDPNSATPEIEPVLAAKSGDFDCVLDPQVTVTQTVDGQALTKMFYIGKTGNDHAVGFAGRFGNEGAFVSNPLPVFRSKALEREPFVLPFELATLLYLDVERNDNKEIYRSIAAGVAPADRGLPTYAPYVVD